MSRHESSTQGSAPGPTAFVEERAHALARQVRELRTCVQRLNHENMETGREVHRHRERTIDLEKQLTHLNAYVIDYQAYHHHLIGEHEAHQQRLVGEHEAYQRQLHEQIAYLETERDQLRAQANDLFQQTCQLTFERDQLRTECERYFGQNEQLKQRLSAAPHRMVDRLVHLAGRVPGLLPCVRTVRGLCLRRRARA